jgi:hypothetical protein
VIGDRDGWCVEFGAHDGYTWSNTYSLITEQGYRAVLLEPDPRRFRELLSTYAGNDRVIPLQRPVGFHPGDSLDAVLAETPIPRDFDVLSIDIDGNDYHVWEAVERYRPKLVLVEYNPTIPTAVEFVQPRDHGVSQGSSLKALVALGRRKGYELILATEANGIFVREEYFPLFGIADNSPEALRPVDEHAFLFQGYDGTIFVSGARRLIWHDWSFNERRFQQLPKFLRKHTDRYTRVDRLLLRLYRRFYNFRTVTGMAAAPVRQEPADRLPDRAS